MDALYMTHRPNSAKLAIHKKGIPYLYHLKSHQYFMPIIFSEIKRIPGQITFIWLPSILEVEFIRAAILLAVKLLADVRACKRVIERVRIILHPSSFIQVAVTLLFSPLHNVASSIVC
jgi:hypothetical protein